MTANEAIARSVSHNEIVTIPEWDEDVATDLEFLSSGSASECGEWWGEDADGNEWRVHIRMESFE